MISLREKYSTFVFKKFTVIEDEKRINIKYEYAISEYVFTPMVSIEKSNITNEHINKDFLNWKLPKKREYKVFSNIPFYITTKIIKKLLLEELNSPTDMWLVMEKGSAKRFMGIPRESKLSLLLKTKFDIKIVHYFNREDFHPMPSVDCVLVYFKRKYKYDISKDEWNEYTSFISKSINNLRDVFTKNQIHAVIKYLGINLNNISEVSYNDWIQLFRYKQKID